MWNGWMSAKGIKKHIRSSLRFYAICGDLSFSLYFKWWFSIRMQQLNNKKFTPKIPYLTPIPTIQKNKKPI